MDLFSTDELLGVVRDLKAPQTFLTRRFFNRVRTSTSKYVHIDIEKRKRRLAPFVHPKSQGKVVATAPFSTNTITPAYIKDKRAFDPEEAIEHRAIGEALTGNLSPKQREDLWVAKTLVDQREMLDRRLEWMAAAILRTSQVTISGEGFPAIVVNFQRDAALSITLAGANRWGQAGIRPLANLKTWGLLTQKTSGAYPNVVIMEPDGFDLFQQDAEVQRLLDTERGSKAVLESAPNGRAEPSFRGVIGNQEFWTYQDWFVDPDTGTETQLLPQYTVLGVSDQLEGIQHYGAVYDAKAGYQALPFFPKMWEEDDPSLTILMAQSAPILAPLRPDASFAAVVN